MKYIPDDLIDVKYIGGKSFKSDTVCGTGLRWERGEVKTVSKDIGLKLIKYSLVWVLVENKKRTKSPKQADKPSDNVSQSTKLDIEANNILAGNETNTNFDHSSALVVDKSEEGIVKSSQMADNKLKELEETNA